MTYFTAVANIAQTAKRTRSLDLAVRADSAEHALKLALDFVARRQLTLLDDFNVTEYPHDPSVFNITDDQPVDWLGDPRNARKPFLA